MTAQGAHLTSTHGDEGESPSIFEVLAQESLVLALRPAMQHMFRVLAERNPSRYGKLYTYSDEVYLGLHCILENYYLKYYSGSFSENFYGMKRVPVWRGDLQKQPNDGVRSGLEDNKEATKLYGNLSPLHRRKSLLAVVLVPYFKSKCDRWFEELKENRHQQPTLQQKWKKHICQVFLRIYPVLHFVYETVLLVSQLAYVFDKSSVHTPLLSWARVVLKNLTDDDLESTYNSSQTSYKDKTWLESVRLLGKRGLAGLAVGLSSALSVGVFFLQFLEWWYASDHRAATLTTLPSPPPPVVRVDNVPKLHTMCPLCQKVRTNDTALAVSGYVFCYGCISRFVTENSRCPVSQYPARTEHLIRLYVPDG